jgi:hypothetical protein
MKRADRRGALLALCLVATGTGCGTVENDQSETGAPAEMSAALVPGAEPDGLAAASDADLPILGATWERITGGGYDIAAVDPSDNPGTWVVGTIQYDGGYRIYRYNPTKPTNPWDAADLGGVRVSAEWITGRPWVVNNRGEIWYMQTAKAEGSANSASGNWIHYPGCAKDIGAGPSFSTTWYVGCQANSAGNYAIYQVGFSGPITSDGAAVRIAVNIEGVPWVVSAAGYVYQRTSTSATSGTWQVRSGAGKASDIAVINTVPWVVSRLESDPKRGYYIQVRDDIAGWQLVNSAVTSIAVGNYLWAVNKEHNVYRAGSYGY